MHRHLAKVSRYQSAATSLILLLALCLPSAAQALSLERLFAFFNRGGDASGQDPQRSEAVDLMGRLSRLGQSHRDNGDYLFEVDELRALVEAHRGKPLQEAFDAMHRELLQRYPGRIADNYRFIINQAGGALGQVAILYASTNEYLIFFGSPIANGGHSGRYNAEFWDIMIDGEMQTFIEGEVERHVYRPGDMAYLPRHQAKGYRIPDHGWMLEYSRGNMVELFPFGVIAPAMFVTLDWTAAYAQISDFAKLVFKNLDAAR
jgi:C-8 sterol isomerase